MAWILWYRLVVERSETIAENPVRCTEKSNYENNIALQVAWQLYKTINITNFQLWCIGLHLVVHYFMLVNYFWMFCEGLHLHLVLVVVSYPYSSGNLAIACTSLHSLWATSVHGRCDFLQPLTWQWFTPSNLSESKSQRWPTALRLRQVEMSGMSVQILTPLLLSIRQVFVKDTIVMRWFIVISWFSPIPIAIVYGLARHFSNPDNKQ